MGFFRHPLRSKNFRAAYFYQFIQPEVGEMCGEILPRHRFQDLDSIIVNLELKGKALLEQAGGIAIQHKHNINAYRTAIWSTRRMETAMISAMCA